MSGNDLRAMASGPLRIADVAIVAGTGSLAYLVREGTIAPPEEYALALGLGTLLLANLAAMARVYEHRRIDRLATQVPRITAAWAATLLVMLAIGYLTKSSDTFSRLWAVLWASGAWAGLVTARLVVAGILGRRRREGRLARRVAVLGAGPAAQRIAERLALRPEEARLAGVFDDAPPRGAAVDGDVARLVEALCAGRVDSVLIAYGRDRDQAIPRVLARLAGVSAEVRLHIDLPDLDIPSRGFATIAGLTTMTVFERPLSGWNLVAKQVEDKVLALVLLVALAPVMAAIALLIRLEGPGPVLFRQKRSGFNNERFTVYKFRTMALDATCDDVVQARRNDPRVTRIGAWLRRTSLDELPQLANVLRGEMSLVGPRPHAVAHNEHFAHLIDGFLARHRVKPGMTGWAQVHGLRGETETIDKMRRRLEFDLHYIENWSLLLDLRILVLTLFFGFTSRNAY